MKKLFFALLVLFSTLGFSQNQTLSGIKTFTSPPKFLNLQYGGTNTKFLTLSPLNQLMWSSLNSITPVTPTFAQVLAAGKQSINNSTAHFSLVGNNISSSYFTSYTALVDTNTGNNSTYGSTGFNNNNNDGRLADFGFAQGLRLRTVAGGGIATLKSTNVSSNISLELPNTSGTLLTTYGTEPDKPIIGDIGFSSANTEHKIKYSIFDAVNEYDTNCNITFSTSGLNLTTSNFAETASAGLALRSYQIEILCAADSPGLVGLNDYSSNVSDNCYIQKQYADKLRGKYISKSTTQINAIIGPEVGETYFNTTISTLCFWDGTTWKRISHSAM